MINPIQSKVNILRHLCFASDEAAHCRRSQLLLSKSSSKGSPSREASGYPLLLAAYMVSCKVTCNEPYSTKSWRIKCRGRFQALIWTWNSPRFLPNIKSTVRADFMEHRLAYPNYPTTFASKRAARFAASSSSTVPGFGFHLSIKGESFR